MKKTVIIAIVLVIMLNLCACGHQHTWVEATCTEPKTCSECGETEGEPLGHSWDAATCTEPKTCKICGETKGEPLGHAWAEATYSAPKTCTRCMLEEGGPLTLSDHDREAYVGKWEAFLIFYNMEDKSYTPKKLNTSISFELYEDMTAEYTIKGAVTKTTWMPSQYSSIVMVKIAGFDNLATMDKTGLFILTNVYKGLKLKESDLPCLQGGDQRMRIFYRRVNE